MMVIYFPKSQILEIPAESQFEIFKLSNFEERSHYINETNMSNIVASDGLTNKSRQYLPCEADFNTFEISEFGQFSAQYPEPFI